MDLGVLLGRIIAPLEQGLLLENRKAVWFPEILEDYRHSVCSYAAPRKSVRNLYPAFIDLTKAFDTASESWPSMAAQEGLLPSYASIMTLCCPEYKTTQRDLHHSQSSVK